MARASTGPLLGLCDEALHLYDAVCMNELVARERRVCRLRQIWRHGHLKREKKRSVPC